MVNRPFDIPFFRQNGRKVMKPPMPTKNPPLTFFRIKPFTFLFVRQIFFSSIQASLCLNLRGRRRCGSPATTSVDPTKELNLAAARSLHFESPATTSMKNLSKICSLISDSPATTSWDPTLFSNLAARLIGTPVGSSCIQILGVPGPASTTNLSSLKRTTSDCKALPLDN